jgi:PncC family amidohydrolase
VGGFLVYSDAMKHSILGIDPALIAEHTAVSTAVAGAMAQAARARTGATYAISTTGEAGPRSNTAALPGTVFVGIAGPGDEVVVRRFNFPGDRARVRMFSAQGALDLLRRKLLGLL